MTNDERMAQLYETVEYVGTPEELRPWQDVPDLATSDDEPDDPDPVPSQKHLRGDLPGHPFRGNQYTGTAGGSAIVATFAKGLKPAENYPDTRFILPDGTRLASRENNHYKAAEALGTTLQKALEAGILRFKPGHGAEVGAPITDAQAQHIIDAAISSPTAAKYGPREMFVDMFSGGSRDANVDSVQYTEATDADTLRRKVNAYFAAAHDLDAGLPPQRIVLSFDLAYRQKLAVLLGETAGHPFRGNQWTEGTTHVGITSARPGRMSSKQVERDMHEFHAELRAVPGVSAVSVVKGQGIFFGAAEPTWVVSYKGNGEARRLLAKTADKYDQDAVLMMKRGKTDAAVDLTFDRHISAGRLQHIQAELSKQGLAGGTWFNRQGRTPTLRMASVQAWGGNKAEHLAATKALHARLGQLGMKSTMATHDIDTEVIERKDYSTIIHGSNHDRMGTYGRADGRKDGSERDDGRRTAGVFRGGGRGADPVHARDAGLAGVAGLADGGRRGGGDVRTDQAAFDLDKDEHGYGSYPKSVRGAALTDEAAHAVGGALDKLMQHFGPDWLAVLGRLHKVGALNELLKGNVDVPALKKLPEIQRLIKNADRGTAINLPDISDVSFPKMIGAIDPVQPKRKRRKPVLYQGVKLSRKPTHIEAEVLSLTEIPPRLDAAVAGLILGSATLAATVQDIADYGSREVCRELVRQGADEAILNAPPPVDATACIVRLEQDRAEEHAAALAAVERRLARSRMTGERRERVVEHLLARRAPGAARWHASRAVNEAFSLGRRTAIAAFRRRHDPISLTYKDDAGKFISDVEAINQGIAVVDAVIMTAVMDTNTCDECAEVDGETMELDDDRVEELRPPYVKCEGGDRCRCVMYVLLDSGKEINIDEIDDEALQDAKAALDENT